MAEKKSPYMNRQNNSKTRLYKQYNDNGESNLFVYPSTKKNKKVLKRNNFT